ncbi:HAD-IC family P-type ATPase [Paucibacter sp. O1-1]|nr:HAD-IC family P-type ATPase [Paucibacter sp. O1-1]MDA3830730.1 HAD-IC family P-type ATPase [Paucibacter sp. O1-1]
MNTVAGQGLTDAQVLASRDRFGRNLLEGRSKNEFLVALISLIKEPMLILLLVAASIYFLTGSLQEGFMMVAAIVLISIVSLYQDTRSRSALEKLRQFTEPKSLVVRNKIESRISVEDIVVGDWLVLQEGERIAADGTIINAHDFSVDESILSGESMSVFRYVSETIYQGTLVASGRAVCLVTAIGNQTRLAQIGESLDSIETQKTPLQIQINHLVRNMALIGAVVFSFVWTINYSRSQNVLDSLMKALTLAMSILPEEIPVAFTTFMALGAFRLMKMGVIVKNAKTIEALGSATIICTDKTGTITENRMSLAGIYLPDEDAIVSITDKLNRGTLHLLSTAMWASEPDPFDPMEIAIHQAYQRWSDKDDRPGFQMVYEYPLSGPPPMMTHAFENAAGTRIIAAKGAQEAILSVCRLSDEEKENTLEGCQ